MFVCELASSPNQCIFDGADLGSIHAKSQVRHPVSKRLLTARKMISANENSAPVKLALAA